MAEHCKLTRFPRLVFLDWPLLGILRPWKESSNSHSTFMIEKHSRYFHTAKWSLVDLILPLIFRPNKSQHYLTGICIRVFLPVHFFEPFVDLFFAEFFTVWLLASFLAYDSGALRAYISSAILLFVSRLHAQIIPEWLIKVQKFGYLVFNSSMVLILSVENILNLHLAEYYSRKGWQMLGSVWREIGRKTNLCHNTTNLWIQRPS